MTTIRHPKSGLPEHFHKECYVQAENNFSNAFEEKIKPKLVSTYTMTLEIETRNNIESCANIAMKGRRHSPFIASQYVLH